LKTKKTLEKDFLSSREAMAHLRISSCDLMHLRLQGKLNFKKKGNAYWYEAKEVMLLNKLLKKIFIYKPNK